MMNLISYVAKAAAPGEAIAESPAPVVDMTLWRYAKIAGTLVSVATIAVLISFAQ